MKSDFLISSSKESFREDKNNFTKKQIRKNHLINKLNYINFQNGTISLNFKHVRFGYKVSLKAEPLPCINDVVECIWLDSEKEKFQQLSAYELYEIQVNDGNNMLVINPGNIEVNEKGAFFTLPEISYEISYRKLRRYSCEGITAQIIQNSVSFSGNLLDFNADSFCVQISVSPPQTFSWINQELNITLVLSDSKEMIYAGECKIIKCSGGRTTRNYILEPLIHEVRRFKPKDFRTTRHQLVPSPYVFFKHPFTQKLITLKINDLSGSGFSVIEDWEDSVLIPGLIIPELELNLANSFKASCKCQVIYRTVIDSNKDANKVKCGLVILDMDILDHGRLLALLHQVKDEKSFLSSNVDLDELWNFFFFFVLFNQVLSIPKNMLLLKRTKKKSRLPITKFTMNRLK